MWLLLQFLHINYFFCWFSDSRFCQLQGIEACTTVGWEQVLNVPGLCHLGSRRAPITCWCEMILLYSHLLTADNVKIVWKERHLCALTKSLVFEEMLLFRASPPGYPLCPPTSLVLQCLRKYVGHDVEARVVGSLFFWGNISCPRSIANQYCDLAVFT